MPGVYGLPPGSSLFAAYQRLIIGHGPLMYFPCTEPPGAAVLSDFMGRYTMTKSGSPLTGGPPLKNGAGASTSILFGTGWIGPPVNPGSSFTVGLLIEAGASAASDSGGWAAWNGNGCGFLLQSGALRFYVGAAFNAVTMPPGSHFWVGTFDGSNANVYLDGELVAGPSARTITFGANVWGINRYSAATKGLVASVSDCFVLPKVLSADQVSQIYRAMSPVV